MKNAKKLVLAALMVAVMAFALCACGSQNADGTYYGDYIDGMAVLVPDIEANKNYLQGYINGED